MVSVIMQETAKYGVGTKVVGRHKHTKEDDISVNRMEQELLKRGWVKNPEFED